MSWQDVVAALVVLGAVAFLATRLLGRRTPRLSKRPDVRADALVRKPARARPRQ